MKTITNFIITFLITALLAFNITAQDKRDGKHDQSKSPVWKLFKVDREYTQQNFKTIGERDALEFARRTDAGNESSANTELIQSLRKQFPRARLQGVFLPDINTLNCATDTRDMVLITPILDDFPHPLDPAGGVVVGDLCSQDDELYDNCTGCSGVDPDTGTYRNCICTRSRYNNPCPAC